MVDFRRILTVGFEISQKNGSFEWRGVRRGVRDYLVAERCTTRHDGNSDLGSHKSFWTPLFPGKFLESKNAADPLISEPSDSKEVALSIIAGPVPEGRIGTRAE